MYNIFNYEKGIVNAVLKMAGMAPFDLYNTPGAWPFVLIFLKLWKQTGYGSIVYLAAITGLDQEMFEAASIDGANAWKKIRYSDNSVFDTNGGNNGFDGNWKYFSWRFWIVLSDS